MNVWPRQRDVLSGKSLFGDPRHGDVVDPKWAAANLTQIAPPYPMYYAGTAIKKITCHKEVAKSLLAVLNSIFHGFGEDIQAIHEAGANIYGGCFNYRVMRGGTTLSMHSYGCAIDLDPARNYLGDSTPKFAEYPIVRNAFQNEGWTWGGDWDGDGDVKDERRPDGMHWQATQYVR